MKTLLNKKEELIAITIRDYFYESNNFNIEDQNRIIRMMGIKSIKYSKCLGLFNPKVTIRLSRPGLFIGKKGLQYQNVSDLLVTCLKENLKIELVEDLLEDFLCVMDYSHI